MASKKFEKGSSEFQWFGTFWGLVQKYWIPEESDDYWDGLVKDINQLYEKYKADAKMERFCKKMAMAYEEFLEDEYRNGRYR